MAHGHAASRPAEAASPAAPAGAAGRAAGSGGRTLNRDFKHVARGRAHAAGDVAPWLAFAAGLACGLAVALFVWLNLRERTPAEPQVAEEITPASQNAGEEATNGGEHTGGEIAASPPPDPSAAQPMDYEFYDLDDMEVEVSHAKPPSTAAPPEELLLQAGAFRSAEQADRLEATLARHGIRARVQRYTIDDENWYRVRIGPLRSAAEQASIRQKLADADIEAHEVKPDSQIPPP